MKIIFSPEHGLFGEAADGEKVNYNGQLNTLPPVEVYMVVIENQKKKQLEGVDVIIYDIQDVGARFYTYITTLGQIMEVAIQPRNTNNEFWIDLIQLLELKLKGLF
ncbi:MAG: hypothetical protein Ct9H300mP18_07430 [Candidatus Neomarinimicrobiota bacterium]|nr:MAG: hypothetical protein Ct9H300mP18_07430 [Candidatus Neomarinimicrobiota bacterium]